ncbi:MAG: glycerate kinase [Lachnospiraceae bacterium]|nr:glycerate kinase [Lachnospiraceae bacterium]
MNRELRNDAEKIIEGSIRAVLPDRAVIKALQNFRPGKGRTVLVAAGKAAWQMASAAVGAGIRIDDGIVITKYGHVKGELPGILCCEAGHPVPDEAGFHATEKALQLVRPLGEDDTVLFLLSGGASALFELPLIPGEELQAITKKLLASGADITEINTIRKRLSGVKGGRFAQAAHPARVYSILLSDVPGNRPDMIGSGPACPDPSTCRDACEIAERYLPDLAREVREHLTHETPKQLEHVDTVITGSVRELCAAAQNICRELSYEPVLLTDELCSEAREAGTMLACIAKTHAGRGRRVAFIAGGETVVHLTGNGKGGRNQELALSAAPELSGIPGVAVFSVGSDGTDGPTDAAGGYADGDTCGELAAKGIDIRKALSDHDSYHALQAVGGLIMTGPTGTNVNDLSVVLVGG